MLPPFVRSALSWARSLPARLRLQYKVLLGALLLGIPTVVLLHYFNVTVDRSIAFDRRALCGLAQVVRARELLEAAYSGAPHQDLLMATEQLTASDAPVCATLPLEQAQHTDSAKVQLRHWLEHGEREPAVDTAALEAIVHPLLGEIGDRFNLILDGDLDSYYVANFLLVHFPEGLHLLRSSRPALDTDLLQRHVSRLTRDFSVAIENNNYYRDSRGTLEASLGPKIEAYLVALQAVSSQPESDAQRTTARSALFALDAAATDWQGRALRARIISSQDWKHRTYAIVAAALLLAVAFASIAVRDTLRRMTSLAALSKRMANGELDLSTPVNGSDEVSSLQRDFNRMASELSTLYRAMERRAEERSSAAHAAETRFRLAIEAAPSGILLCNADGEIVFANAHIETLFGYTRDELVGRPVEVLVPTQHRPQHPKVRKSLTGTHSSRPMGGGRELYGLRKDGVQLPIEIGLSTMETPQGRFVLASVIDISERIAAEKLRAAAQANALRRTILENLPASVIATSTDGTIVAVNPAAEQLLGYSNEEMIGHASIMMHEPEELQHRATALSLQLGRTIAPGFEAIIANGTQLAAAQREWTYVRKDGTRVPVDIAITALRDESGQITGYLKVANDITARKHAEATMRRLASHDALTGLPNRTLLNDRLEMALRQALRHNQQVAVLLMDLDHFKNVNDSLGHQVGDQLLVTISQRLQKVIRTVDTVARLGGDEFVIVINEVGGQDALTPMLIELIRAVSEPMNIEGHDLHITPSIGGCIFPLDGNDPETLLKKADAAMYQAKARGRSTVEWFNETMLQETQERLALANALRNAITAEELSIHYQPEISLKTGRVIGVEALLRWNHPSEGNIPPTRFIEIAEENGLILQLGEWALRKACCDCMQLQQQLNRRLTLAVNVSPRQFQQSNWLAVVVSALEHSGLNPNHLELEITEGMLMKNPEVSIETLRAIRQLGVGIVIDDFGTGYSSLAYLTRFPIDKIKIDRSFVHSLTTNATESAIVNAIIAMAQRLGLRVIAEGVETLPQQSYLLDQGCDEAQGFLYAKGLPGDELAAHLADIEAAIKIDTEASGTRVA